ncbi:MAG: flagellar biosynthesis protein FliQ [Gemmatimonadaceae bacterium]|nr:flagellar biosynthesis protein FliQ [Acetobacteraceae bacterium]
MDPNEVGGALRDTLWVMLKLGGPLLVAALVVGLLVSLVQAVTQVNEATLVFLPKLLVLFAALALLGPFMTATLTDYTRVLMDRMVTVGGQ